MAAAVVFVSAVLAILIASIVWMIRMDRRGEIVLDLLHEHGPMTGLQLVKASGGRLKRGTIYVLLAAMQERGEVLRQDDMYAVRRGPTE